VEKIDKEVVVVSIQSKYFLMIILLCYIFYCVNIEFVRCI
jgi:hypothetical protein